MEKQVMARKEEIKKGAFDAFPNEGWERQRVSFVQGALWADEHPRKGLVDIEKVCKWLALNAEVYGDINRGNLNIMINIFKKEMEE